MATLAVVTAAGAVSVPAIDVSDDFDRSDDCDVGNSWSEYEHEPCSLRVEDGKLVFYDRKADNRWGLAHRNMTLGPVGDEALSTIAPVNVTFEVYEGAARNEDGRIQHGFRILDDGTGDGYGIHVSRTSTGWDNSRIRLMDDGQAVDTISLDEQLPAHFTVNATVHADGAIEGELIREDRVFETFAFDAHDPAADGDQIAVYMVQLNDANPRPAIDDVRFQFADETLTGG